MVQRVFQADGRVTGNLGCSESIADIIAAEMFYNTTHKPE